MTRVDSPWEPDDAAVSYVLEASTGRQTQAIPGLTWLRTADFDGDGLADLWGTHAGKVLAFRGAAPEVWRRFGDWQSAPDFDGDGTDDLLSPLSGPASMMGANASVLLQPTPEPVRSMTARMTSRPVMSPSA